jgi:hypothetical protein
MESYGKAADGGNCLAMMAIGDLYAAGSGVRPDQAQAQSWKAKAQSCQAGTTAVLQQELAKYKARAAAARDPALYPVLAALPNIPNGQTQAARSNSRSPAQAGTDRSGFNSSLASSLVAAAMIVVAAGILNPHEPTDIESSHLDTVMNGLRTTRCSVVNPGINAINSMLTGC